MCWVGEMFWQVVVGVGKVAPQEKDIIINWVKFGGEGGVGVCSTFCFTWYEFQDSSTTSLLFVVRKNGVLKFSGQCSLVKSRQVHWDEEEGEEENRMFCGKY